VRRVVNFLLCKCTVRCGKLILQHKFNGNLFYSRSCVTYRLIIAHPTSEECSVEMGGAYIHARQTYSINVKIDKNMGRNNRLSIYCLHSLDE